MRCAAVGLLWTLTACAGSDLGRRLDSDEVSVAYVQIRSATKSSYSCWKVDGELRKRGGASVFDGTLEGCLAESEDLLAMRPEDVIASYVSSAGSPTLVQGWSEPNGETVCRLYRGEDGREHLLLCQLYGSAVSVSSDSGSSPSARTIEKRANALRVGIRCVEHDEWVLFFLFPWELEDSAPQALARVLATMKQLRLRCPIGGHAVAGSDTE